MNIAAHILIAISSVLYGVSVFAKNKRFLLVVQILSSGLYCTHCFLLKAWVGAIISLLDVTRIVIFYIIEKLNGTQKHKIIAGVVLLIIGIIASICTWGAWYSIFPLLGTIVYVSCLAISNLTLIKFATIFGAGCSVIYLALIGSHFGAILETMAVLIGLVALVVGKIKLAKNKH